jgi:hypothetical protein
MYEDDTPFGRAARPVLADRDRSRMLGQDDCGAHRPDA